MIAHSDPNIYNVLIDADLLVDETTKREILTLLNSYSEVNIQVVGWCLLNQCDSHEHYNNFRHDLSSLSSQIKIIDIEDYDDFFKRRINRKINDIVEKEENQRIDEDSTYEVAYAKVFSVSTIVTGNLEHFKYKNNHRVIDSNNPPPDSNVKVITLEQWKEELEQLNPLTIPEHPPTPPIPYPPPTPPVPHPLIQWLKGKFLGGVYNWFWVLFVLAILGVVVFSKFVYSPYCPLIPDEFISCGESILITEENQTESFMKHQKSGMDDFKVRQYDKAVSSFKSAFKEYKSPETLIYLNNALLETYKRKANTIAVAVPITKAKETGIGEDEDPNLAKEILRGVAQVQTLVNRCLLPEQFDSLNFLDDSIKINDDLCKEIQQKGKGLRVIIADDENKPDTAKNLASELNELNKKSILAVIGHYPSDLSKEVLPNYQKNNLVLISGGSTSEILNLMQKDVFFRTVPTYNVQLLTNYLNENNLKKVAVFYNQDSDFSGPLAKKFKEEFEKIGGKVAEEIVGKDNKSDSFNQAAFDFAAAINQAQSADAFVLIPDGQTTKSLPNAIKIIQENKGNKPILGTWTLRSNRTLKAVKDNHSAVTNRKLIVYSPYDSKLTTNQDYVEQAKKLWGDASPPVTATNYDAVWVLVNAFLKDKNPKRTDLKGTLETIGTVKKGATGDISFDENGNRNNLEMLLVKVIPDSNPDTHLKFVPLSE